MKYVVIGAGGTGGPLGAYLAEGGKDVTVIVRGEHLSRIRERGLRLETTFGRDRTICPMKAEDMEHYGEKADVIFVCVKGYSLESTVPFIKKIAHENTVVIPILNIYGTGGMLQEELPGILVTDGCGYVSANIKEPGTIFMHGEIFRVVFGVRKPEEYRPILHNIAEDLEECGICAVLSDNIRRDALRKFSYVSPIGVCGVYFDVTAGAVQREGKEREFFCTLIREIESLAEAMGIDFGEDMVKVNLKILDDLDPVATTSMQRDLRAGRQSEADGLIREVIRLGERYHVPTPAYCLAADKIFGGNS